jgi:hypothetical protein
MEENKDQNSSIDRRLEREQQRFSRRLERDMRRKSGFHSSTIRALESEKTAQWANKIYAEKSAQNAAINIGNGLRPAASMPSYNSSSTSGLGGGAESLNTGNNYATAGSFGSEINSQKKSTDTDNGFYTVFVCVGGVAKQLDVYVRSDPY